MSHNNDELNKLTNKSYFSFNWHLRNLTAALLQCAFWKMSQGIAVFPTHQVFVKNKCLISYTSCQETFATIATISCYPSFRNLHCWCFIFSILHSQTFSVSALFWLFSSMWRISVETDHCFRNWIFVSFSYPPTRDHWIQGTHLALVMAGPNTKDKKKTSKIKKK